MTDKTTNQIEEMLDGIGRYKLLDPNRKAVLSLPASAFKLWMTYWMFESDSQEAYPSMETLVKVTSMTEKTIRTAREYLLKTGWLVKLTGSAAERFIKPSNGSWNVAIYRVDDPQKFTGENLTGEKMTLPKIPPNVSTAFASAVAFASTSVSTPTSTCTRNEVHKDDDSLRSSEKQKPKQPQQQKQQQPRPTSATKWLARYGEEKPADFESWSQVERTRWCIEHSDCVVKQERLATLDEEVSIADVPVKPIPATPPPPPEDEPTAKELFADPEPDVAEIDGDPDPDEKGWKKIPTADQWKYVWKCASCGWETRFADQMGGHRKNCKYPPKKVVPPDDELDWGFSKPSFRCRTCGGLREVCLCL